MHDCRIFQANADQLLDPGAIYCAVKHYIQQWCQMKLTFGPFELASRERALRRGGLVLPLGSRALDILICLVNRPGEVITKKELIDHVWPNVFVEEGVLRVHMASIRKVLGDGQFGNRYIANIYGRGYSFVGVVRLGDSRVDRAQGSLAET